MMEKYIIRLPIDHLDSQFLISKLADALPLLLLFVVVRWCVEWELWAPECLPTRVPIP